MRARGLGLPFPGRPGPNNAVTDVPGVLVGYQTLMTGRARTGVTAILPRGFAHEVRPVWAGYHALNGNGEMTGTHWIEDAGYFCGPICLTNTHSLGIAHHAVVRWMIGHYAREFASDHVWAMPVVAETYDGGLNDVNGCHVKPAHVFAALDSASSGSVAEGNVGGGTGMVCYGFKCGTGTASRILGAAAGAYTVGVLVQANHGGRNQLRVGGAPVGTELADAPADRQEDEAPSSKSIIVVIATDAPVLPHQLKRIARRASLGLARTGSTSNNFSGDIFLAFSTANRGAAAAGGSVQVNMVANPRMSALFDATVQATEEAIVNALIAGETMKGNKGAVVAAIPHDRLREVLEKYGRLERR